MHVTFNGNTFAIPTNDQGQYHATALSQACAAAGGQVVALQNWKQSLSEVQINKFCLLTKRGSKGGTWVNKRGLLAFAAYCSSELEAALSSEFRKTSRYVEKT